MSRLDEFQQEMNVHCPYGDAGAFSNIYRYNHRLRIEMIYEILRKELNPKKLLLDAGCWVGAYSMLLSSHVGTIGIDVSRTYITNAKKWCHEEGKRSVIDFIICDIEHLPFRRGSFDLLICSETLEHLKHIGRGLTELVRALKTGGKAVISMPNRFSLYFIFRRFFPIVNRGKLSLYLASLNPHLKFDFSKIRKMILDAKLEIIATQSVMIIPINPTRLFYETVVRVMTHIERKLNKTPLRNLGAFYILKVQKPSSTHGVTYRLDARTSKTNLMCENSKPCMHASENYCQ